MTAKTFLLQASASRPRSNHFKNEHNNIPLAPVPIAPNTNHHNNSSLEFENDGSKKKKKSSLVVRTSKHWVLPQDQDLVEDHLLTTLYLPTTPKIF